MPEKSDGSTDGRHRMQRRTFLKGAGVAAAGAAVSGAIPALALGAPGAAQSTSGAKSLRRRRELNRAAGADRPVPKVLRSRRELEATGLAEPTPAGIPITQNGTTYEMAQETRWLDPDHFAVGRWDGSMSLFEFETAEYVGPLINVAVNGPAFQGVEMVTPLPGNAILTSNDESSVALWHASGGWTNLKLVGTSGYEPSLGFATSGVALTSTSPACVVIGHISGFLSIWSYEPSTRTLTFERSVDVRNAEPTNPFEDHTIEDVVIADSASAVVAAGSEDGYVTMMNVPSGTILSQTVFNPAAQRGINALAITGTKLLVANCSVGPEDFNTWYYAIDKTTWAITLLDEANLVIDTSLPQVFNFDLEWGRYSGGRCWFASTEEGTIWMGTASGKSLNPIGYEQLTGPLGSALAYRSGQLAMVAYDLYQFTTGA
jgi:TAT (twin-arginine translocation) pathway signal sequence